MLKKTMALVLTLMMTTALAVPMVALANGSSADYGSSDMNSADVTSFSSGQEGESKVTFKAKTDVPKLELTITGGGGLVMNPYGIARNSTAFGITSEKSQVISTKLTIASTTDVPVKVGARVQAKVSSASDDTKKAVTLATSINHEKDTTKKVALWLLASENATNLKLENAKGKTANVFGETGTVGVLPIKTAYVQDKIATENVNASLYKLGASNSSCVLQFVGEMVAAPLDNPWQEGDKIEPTVILNFQLQELGAGA